MDRRGYGADPIVHCRTGSLENQRRLDNGRLHVHCRTGSLESQRRIRY